MLEVQYSSKISYGQHKGVCLIPSAGPVTDDFFSTIPGMNFDLCDLQCRLRYNYSQKTLN